MKKNPNIDVYWIDDDVSDRNEDVANIENKNKNLKLILIHPDEFVNHIYEKVNSKKQPDLFLCDYFLNRIINEQTGKKFPHQGFTVAGIIREKYPEFPIYGVTVEDSEKSNGIFGSRAQAAEEVYDKIFSLRIIKDEGYKILYYDAIDFERIRVSKRGNVNTLLDLLKAPLVDSNRLRLILPNDLKKGLKFYDSGNSIAFSRWVLKDLLFTPGFLYNKLQSATHVGMTTVTFERHINKFNESKYTGIFSETSEPLWWVSKLDEKIFSYQVSKKSSEVSTQKLATKIFKLSKNQSAKCIRCGELFPETVGINLDDEDDKKPVHYKCSIPHPKLKNKMYFDEPRAFKLA